MAAGDIVFYVDLQDVIDGSLQKPLVKLVQQTLQSFAHNVDTPITFGTSSEIIDTHGFHSETVNNTRVTPTVAGYYRCTGLFFVDSVSTITNYGVVVRLNGTVVAPRQRVQPSAQTFTKSVQVTTTVQVNGSTDFLDLCGYQFDTGAVARNSVVGGSFGSTFEVEFIRGL